MWLTGRYAMPLVIRYFLPNLLPRKPKDFPRGDNHSEHMRLLTYLGLLQPIYYDPKLVFKHVKNEKTLLVVKTLIKNIEQQPHLSAAINQKIKIIAPSKNAFQNMKALQTCSLKNAFQN